MFVSLKSFQTPAALILFSISAAAHEVKEMTARARVFNNRVEMVITVSNHMANLLLADPKQPGVVLTPESVPALRTRLESQARAFCKLLAGGKKALAPSSVDVVMATSEELSFYLAFPTVAQSPLRFDMTVLDRLEEGNVVMLDVVDASRKPIGSKQLKRGDSILDVALPEKAPELPK